MSQSPVAESTFSRVSQLFFPTLPSQMSAAVPNHINHFLHFGEREYILMSFWKSGTAFGMVGSVLIIALISILHEAVLGLRYFLDRECLYEQLERQSRESLHRTRSESSLGSSISVGKLKKEFKKVFTKQRTVQALLYAAQWLLFYVLILVIVTFNVWLILAVVFGKAIGYFIFIGSPTAERALAADRSASFRQPAMHLASHSAST
ncbi:Protein F31E8.4 [Aphelenchoides avenae]|nr:Protein F31E8.4 [Aphelenchus avenae]